MSATEEKAVVGCKSSGSWWQNLEQQSFFSWNSELDPQGLMSPRS